MRIALYAREVQAAARLAAYAAQMAEGLEKACEYVSYATIDNLIWDVESMGEFDVVVIYEEWGAAEKLRRKYNTINIVMVVKNVGLEIYDVQPCYLIHEPLCYQGFDKVMRSALSATDSEPVFAFRSGRTGYRLRTRNILYFESEKRRINVICGDGRYSFYGTMSEVENRLQAARDRFVRIHESYIVNLDYAKELGPACVVMTDGTTIGISAGRRAFVRQKCEKQRLHNINKSFTL